MTDEEREEIRSAARGAARESRLAQGLPEMITDPEALAQMAALMRPTASGQRSVEEGRAA